MADEELLSEDLSISGEEPRVSTGNVINEGGSVKSVSDEKVEPSPLSQPDAQGIEMKDNNEEGDAPGKKEKNHLLADLFGATPPPPSSSSVSSQ